MNRDTLELAVKYIKSWLTQRYEAETIPGLVVGLSRHGDMVMNEAYGFADLERQVPMTTNHVFRIASHSKTFTATAIMMLAEAGQLRIDNPVTDYLPWLREHRDSRFSHVTLRQLLSHGAGVIRDGLNTDYWEIERPFPDAQRFVSEMMETGLVLENNTKMKYTNYGYTLLGLVVESVSGQPYNEFVQDRIVHPLGLMRTFPEYRPELDQPPGEALVTGYTQPEPKERLPIAAISTHVMSPATGFCSTAQELCTYFTAQMVGSGKLLSDESKKEMQRPEWPMLSPGRPRDTDYGLGFILRRFEERQTFGHSGGFPGCITNTMADPKDGLVVSVLTNAADGPASSILAGIYRIINYFDKHESTTSDDDWSALEGTYSSLRGSFDIVAAGDSLVAVYGAGWSPFEAVEKLEFVEGQTFKIVETGSGGSEGELVHFETEADRVTRMVYAGTTFWPLETWREKIAQRVRISL